MSTVVFFIAALGAIAGAAGVISLRNPFYSVLALVGHLICLALLFLLLRAEFVAAAQVVVYAGAVMVLYIFVVAYIGGTQERLRAPVNRGEKLVAGLGGASIFAVILIAVLATGLKGLGTRGAPYSSGTGDAARDAFGTPGAIGELLLTRFLLPFELASFLLTIAAVGAVTLARRRGGLETEQELQRLTPLDFVRPSYTGTMAEAVGGSRNLPPAQREEAESQTVVR